MLTPFRIFFASSDEKKTELIDWSEGSDGQRCVSDGPKVRSVRTVRHRGGACAAGGAEGHEASQEGGAAPQVSSDDLCGELFTGMTLVLWLIMTSLSTKSCSGL